MEELRQAIKDLPGAWRRSAVRALMRSSERAHNEGDAKVGIFWHALACCLADGEDEERRAFEQAVEGFDDEAADYIQRFDFDEYLTSFQSDGWEIDT
jgi:hypothetical protein